MELVRIKKLTTKDKGSERVAIQARRRHGDSAPERDISRKVVCSTLPTWVWDASMMYGRTD